MPTTRISLELYGVFMAADNIAYKMMIGAEVTEEDLNRYRKETARWRATVDTHEPDLPNRCREEGV